MFSFFANDISKIVRGETFWDIRFGKSYGYSLIVFNFARDWFRNTNFDRNYRKHKEKTGRENRMRNVESSVCNQRKEGSFIDENGLSLVQENETGVRMIVIFRLKMIMTWFRKLSISQRKFTAKLQTDSKTHWCTLTQFAIEFNQGGG